MRKTILFALVVATSGLTGMVSQTTAQPAATNQTPTKQAVTNKPEPMLPSGKWHVHDMKRPMAPVVASGSTFSHGAPAPSDAIVLFDGTDLSKWEGDKGKPAGWTLHEDYMEVKPKTGYIHTKEKFGDFQLHLEFAEPSVVKGKSQGRGNSGVFLQGLYEVQVLDSYDNPTYADGQCGGIYGQTPPMANSCKKPGQWQTYDIVFEAARWDANHKLARPAMVTVIQNGVLIHNQQPIIGPTQHGRLASYDKELPATGSLALQDHGDLVRFRNIWIRKIHDEEQP
jgi:hypothetical protein